MMPSAIPTPPRHEPRGRAQPVSRGGARRWQSVEAAAGVLERCWMRTRGRPQVARLADFAQAEKLPPPKRRLRVYALDPSMTKSLDFVAVNETTLCVPLGTTGERSCKPGPVGEYLEVIDVDPASDRVYDPVDLNKPKLLAQDGWPPSEGNPQFHQQMVYAVAMTTIGHFEQALGRLALWAPRLCGQ